MLAKPSREPLDCTSLSSTGVDTLDAMIGGGVPVGSTTLILGPTGSGKTTVGLQFLSAAPDGEAGLHFGFFESPARLLGKADSVGLKLRSLVDSGQVELAWQPPTEDLIDALAEQLLEAVRRRKVKRLVIDGLSAFRRLNVNPDRVPSFFAALINELRAMNVTTFASLEVSDLIGPISKAPVSDLSIIAENLILLRYVELRSRLYRLISVLKVRDGDCDPTLRELLIGSQGLSVGASFSEVQAQTTGFGRLQNDDPAMPPGADA